MNVKHIVILTIALFTAVFTLHVSTAQARQPQNSPSINQVMYAVSGNVVYKINSSFKRANKVLITATNNVTSEQTSTTTNSKGTYALLVPTGDYTISASDSRGTPFLPANYQISVTSDTAGVNFVGNVR